MKELFALAFCVVPSVAQAAETDIRAAGFAETSIKATLRDPDSFEWSGWKIVHFNDVPFFVCAQFRARNGFGGYNVQSAIVDLVDSKDLNNAQIHFAPSRKAWKRICVEYEPGMRAAAAKLAASKK